MIAIRDESDLHNWFKKNYEKLGFTKILKYNASGFPDFIMQEKDKRVKLELEIKASNFILHKHDPSKVDKVICIEKNVELDIPVIELDGFKIVESSKQTPYSIVNLVYQLFNKEQILTTSEVGQKLGVNWNTAEKALLELTIDGKVQRIKKVGVNLWLKMK
jgi:hypothetical protein